MPSLPEETAGSDLSASILRLAADGSVPREQRSAVLAFGVPRPTAIAIDAASHHLWLGGTDDTGRPLLGSVEIGRALSLGPIGIDSRHVPSTLLSLAAGTDSLNRPVLFGVSSTGALDAMVVTDGQIGWVSHLAPLQGVPRAVASGAAELLAIVDNGQYGMSIVSLRAAAATSARTRSWTRSR